MNKKMCTKCEKEKSLTEFTKNKWKKDGHASECKSCRREYRKTHKEIGRRHTFKYRYGISLSEKLKIIKNQGSKCSICGKFLDLNNPFKVHMDHNHRTKKIRGVLCSRCNHFLGYVRENIVYLEKVIIYLKYWDSTDGQTIG
jgi:hypothetical protein